MATATSSLPRLPGSAPLHPAAPGPEQLFCMRVVPRGRSPSTPLMGNFANERLHVTNPLAFASHCRPEVPWAPRNLASAGAPATPCLTTRPVPCQKVERRFRTRPDTDPSTGSGRPSEGTPHSRADVPPPDPRPWPVRLPAQPAVWPRRFPIGRPFAAIRRRVQLVRLERGPPPLDGR
jgi:hypothetical protein